MHLSVSPQLTAVNDRRMVFYDAKTRRASLLQEFAMKRRFFGSDKIDEPTGEWADELAPQPMLDDIAFLFELFLTAFRELNPGNAVALSVVRIRSRSTRRPHSLLRPSTSGKPQGAAASADRAQQWESLLAHSRVQLVADALVARGIPRTCVHPKVDTGMQDCYYVEFQFLFAGSTSSGSAEIKPAQ